MTVTDRHCPPAHTCGGKRHCASNGPSRFISFLALQEVPGFFTFTLWRWLDPGTGCLESASDHASAVEALKSSAKSGEARRDEGGAARGCYGSLFMSMPGRATAIRVGHDQRSRVTLGHPRQGKSSDGDGPSLPPSQCPKRAPFLFCHVL